MGWGHSVGSPLVAVLGRSPAIMVAAALRAAAPAPGQWGKRFRTIRLRIRRKCQNKPLHWSHHSLW